MWRETFLICLDSDRRKISIHSLRVEGDAFSPVLVYTLSNFNPLPPCGGRHFFDINSPSVVMISIHSLRVEGDHAAGFCGYCIFYFNPLPPCGGRRTPHISVQTASDFNPLPPCGGRLRIYAGAQSGGGISIHSLRVEGDPLRSKRSPACLFQSTPSVWRETVRFHGKQSGLRYFNPLPPCGGRLPARFAVAISNFISIHSLRVEGDLQFYKSYL